MSDSILDDIGGHAYGALKRAAMEYILPKPIRHNPQLITVCNDDGEVIIEIKIMEEGIKINDCVYEWGDPKTGDAETWYQKFAEILEIISFFESEHQIANQEEGLRHFHRK